MANFWVELGAELVKSLPNHYTHDNWDSERFEVLPELSKPREYKRRISNGLKIARRHNLSKTYVLLADDYSRKLFVKLMAFRILGFRKVKLPTNNAQYWAAIEQAKSLQKEDNALSVSFHNWSLNHFSLEPVNYPIRLYSRQSAVAHQFILKQYAYQHGATNIVVQPTDVVIDAGGCWGDTALGFAADSGDGGIVYTFEFVPENLQIMQENLRLNPNLANRVCVIENALAQTSDQQLTISVNGPGSRIGEHANANHKIKVRSVSIDGFVQQHSISKVDFIKMDIEGAEYQSLHGARETILRYQPKLAISLYHSLDDFVRIPQFLASLDCPYQFFLGHGTIHAEETVLFATPN